MNVYRLAGLVFLAALLIAAPAEAYVGPGLGLGTIGTVLGILVSVGLALFALVWYPIKRMLKKRRAAEDGQ